MPLRLISGMQSSAERETSERSGRDAGDAAQRPGRAGFLPRFCTLASRPRLQVQREEAGLAGGRPGRSPRGRDAARSAARGLLCPAAPGGHLIIAG